MTTHRDKASFFRSLHGACPVLVLPNAWDVVSARLVEDVGAAALATTSAGVAWSVGTADGDQLDRDRALDLIARVVAAVDIPVTADIESGYANHPDAIAETVRGVLAAGAVGINIEDSHHGGSPPLRSIEEQSDRIAAAREAADAVQVPLFVNARVDTYLTAAADPTSRLRDTAARAAAYVAAGADGVFVPGVTDPVTVAALVERVAVPLNIMAGPGCPTVAELAALGVARVSVGAAITLAAYAVARRCAEELLTSGTYTAFGDTLDYGSVNALLSSQSHAGSTTQ